MRQVNLTPQQQKEYVEKFNARMDKVIMSWDNELRYWHEIAIKALDFADSRSLQVRQHLVIKLFEVEKMGLNMNVVGVLCNNVEGRAPHEMGYTAREWADILVINQNIAMRWQALAEPHQKALNKEYEILNGRGNGLKIITGQA